MEPNIHAKNLQKIARENPIKHIFVWSVEFWHEHLESQNFAFYVCYKLEEKLFWILLFDIGQRNESIGKYLWFNLIEHGKSERTIKYLTEKWNHSNYVVSSNFKSEK